MQRLPFAAIFFACLIPAFGQTKPQLPVKIPLTQPVSDAILFHFFFVHVASAERAANSLKAQGGDDSPARNYFKNRASLTGTEASLVKEVAMACNADFATESQAGMAEVDRLRAQYGQVSAKPPVLAQRLEELEARRQRVITDCMRRLQNGMGPVRYRLLYNFVRGAETPAAKKLSPGVTK